MFISDIPTAIPQQILENSAAVPISVMAVKGKGAEHD
jgi:hypothetical protein